MKKYYIQAVVSLIAKGNAIDAVLTNLVSVLATNGHSHLHVQILKGVVRQLEKQLAAEIPTVTVASHSHSEVAKAQIQKTLEEMHAPSEYALAVDQTLVGGFTITYQDQYIDSSYKNALVTVYRSIVAYH